MVNNIHIRNSHRSGWNKILFTMKNSQITVYDLYIMAVSVDSGELEDDIFFSIIILFLMPHKQQLLRLLYVVQCLAIECFRDLQVHI